MNGVEERLRDALTARAATVTQDPHAYDTIVRRRTRYRRTRVVRPIVGALAAAATVAAILSVVPGPGKQNAVPAVGGPRLVLALRERDVKDPAGHSFPSNEAVLLDARTLGGPPVLRVEADTYEVEAIAAAGDDLTFYAAARADRCRMQLLRLGPETGTAPIGTFAGWQPALAVSRDGRQLAFAYTPIDDADTCNTKNELAVTVRDLVTGTERTWTAPESADGGGRLSRLAWSPDGHTLAFQQGLLVGTMDTAAPGGTIPLPERTSLFLEGPNGADCTAEAPAYLPGGELAVVWFCTGNGVSGSAVSLYDVERQKAIRTLFRLPDDTDADWLTFDRTGRHALVGLERKDGRRGRDPLVVVRWDGEGKPKQIDVGDDRMVDAAW